MDKDTGDIIDRGKDIKFNKLSETFISLVIESAIIYGPKIPSKNDELLK